LPFPRVPADSHIPVLFLFSFSVICLLKHEFPKKRYTEFWNVGMCFPGYSKFSAITGYIGFTALPNIPELSGLFFLLLNVISIVIELGICA
jgi:hypothetical protein